MPIATIGRSVIVLGIVNNGALEHPGVITRAWSAEDTARGPVAVNVTVFMDAGPVKPFSSVLLFDSAAIAHRYRGENPTAIVAHWPART